MSSLCHMRYLDQLTVKFGIVCRFHKELSSVGKAAEELAVSLPEVPCHKLLIFIRTSDARHLATYLNASSWSSLDRVFAKRSSSGDLHPLQ
jgi:hypothetical protein